MELRSGVTKRSDPTDKNDEITSSNAAAGTSGGVAAPVWKRKPIYYDGLMARLIIKAKERARAKEEYRAYMRERAAKEERRAKKKAKVDVNPSGSGSVQVDSNQNLEQETYQANKTHPTVATDQGTRKEKCSTSKQELFNADRLPLRLFCTDRYPKGGRMNSYSRSEYLFELVDALDGWELAWIKASCFGSLFSLPFRKCALSGKLLHQFLCRSLVIQKKEEMWFVFGGHPIRFSLREFGILTGLNCAPYPCEEILYRMTNPPDDEETVDEEDVEQGESPADALEKKKHRYYHMLIGPNKAYTIQSIIDLLKADLLNVGEGKMDSHRRLRLALIVIVDGVVACNTSTGHATYDTAYMAKNLDTFVKYPWGHHSFEKTIEMVTVAGKKVGSVDKLVEKLCQSHTANHGFTLAFQLLILRAIPAFEKFLPDISDEVTICDRPLSQLTMLKTFHNSNILETELSPSLAVESIIPGDGDRDMQDYSWGEDETEDVAVEYMLRWLKAGHIFKKEDWHGGVDHLDSITACFNRHVNAGKGGPKVRAKRQGKGHCKTKVEAKTKKGDGDGEASKSYVDSMSAEDILREVDRRHNEHTLKIQQMLSRVTDAMDEMRNEMKNFMMEKKSSSCSVGGGSNQGGDKGKGKIHVVSSDDEE